MSINTTSRLLFALTAISACLPAAHAQTTVTELLKNRDFAEPFVNINLGQCSGRIPTNWTTDNCGATVDFLQGTDPSSGQYAIVRNSGNGANLQQFVAVKPNFYYKLTVWLRTPAPTPTRVTVSLRQVGWPYNNYGTRTFTVSNQWTPVTLRATTDNFSLRQQNPNAKPGDTPLALFRIETSRGETFEADNASMTEIGATPLTPPQGLVPKEYFGTHIHNHYGTTDVPSLNLASGIGAIRMWDSTGTIWPSIEPRSSTQHDASYPKKWVARSTTRHIDSIIMLGHSPTWAASRITGPDGTGICGTDSTLGNCSEPTMVTWTDWVNRIGTELNGPLTTETNTTVQGSTLPKYWEIWNEPYFNPGSANCMQAPSLCTPQTQMGDRYTGTPETLVALQNAAATAIKTFGVTNNKIVSPGISYHHPDYLDYYLGVGGGDKADIIGYHFYEPASPEHLIIRVRAVREIMKQRNVFKPLWNTEGSPEAALKGPNPADNPTKAWQEFFINDPAFHRLGLENTALQTDVAQANATFQAQFAPAYMARFMINGWAVGLGRSYQYAWDHGAESTWFCLPVTRDSSGAVTGITAVGKAYNETSAWMVGRKMASIDDGTVNTNGHWVVTMQDAGTNAKSYIVWHPGYVQSMAASKAITWTVPAGVTRMRYLDVPTGQYLESAVPASRVVPVGIQPIRFF